MLAYTLSKFLAVRWVCELPRARRTPVLVGLVVAAQLALVAFNLGWIGGRAWMTLVGVGLYLAYAPYNGLLFDRLVALLRSVGTAVFAINLADAVG